LHASEPQANKYEQCKGTSLRNAMDGPRRQADCGTTGGCAEKQRKKANTLKLKRAKWVAKRAALWVASATGFEHDEKCQCSAHGEQ